MCEARGLRERTGEVSRLDLGRCKSCHMDEVVNELMRTDEVHGPRAPYVLLARSCGT